MKFTLKEIDNIDKHSFNWQYLRKEMPTPPIAININNINYQISNFTSISNKYLFVEVDDFFSALELSISLYDNINYIELSNIINITEKFNIDFNEISIFQEKNLKNNKNIEIIKNIYTLPKDIKKYIVKKDVPLKIISIILSFNEFNINFIKDRLILDKEPSLNDFINFVNNVADFKNEVENISYYKGFSFPEKISPIRREFDTIIKEINKKISPIKLINSDNFEKGSIDFLFSSSNIKDFEKSIEILKNNVNEINILFQKMKDNDIC